MATAIPDSYNWISLTNAQINMTLTKPMTPGSPSPSSMSGRDAFRAPGWWNLDFGVFKGTKITERFSLQLRGELFNIFNHANLYVVGNSAAIRAANSITACYGGTGSSYDRRNMQLAATPIF